MTKLNYRCTSHGYKPTGDFKKLNYPPVVKGTEDMVIDYCKWLFGKNANFAMSETTESEDILL